MQVKDQLLKLMRLQQLVLETRAARKQVDDAPARIAEIEERFRERNAEYVAVKDRHDALDEDQRTRSSELTTLEENRKKYMDDLMQVQNQREYAAMLREIDSVKSAISEHEEAILRDLEEIESVKTELESHESHIQEERKKVEQEHAEIDAASASALESIERLGKERAELEASLPANLTSAVRRLEAGRQGIFLAKAEDGICQSCFVRIRPQNFQEIKLASKVHSCSSCRRLLYNEPSLKRIAEEQGGAGPKATDADPVEAVNDGGAV